MKALITKQLALILSIFLFSFVRAQEDWPKTITSSDGSVIKVYQPEPESFSGNVYKFRSAFSVIENGATDPIFGTFWTTSRVQTDRDNREVVMESATVTDLKLPAESDQTKLDLFRSTLETQLPSAAGHMPLDELLSSLDQNLEEAKLSNGISNNPPKVYFTTQPSILVLIDGNPKLQRNTDWGVDVVVNSPYTIIHNTDNQYYLYGGHHWYTAVSATGPYSYIANVPENLNNIETALNSNNNNSANPNTSSQPANNQVSNIIVSTVPAELIQSNGEPNFTPIDGTALLYMKNSDNDIFMDVNDQQYYVLISGRWYTSKGLNSNQWTYIPADKIPADFAKIPEGSPKDNVLASVAGTPAAHEALMDAQIPQTAKIDRHTATTNPTYNGSPEFRSISGTHLEYAVNTSSTVLRYKGQYYAVDNGVWFVSTSPTGPWAVATERPDDVDMIPPSSPAYNTKYVYVYDYDPDYVYMGYTPGYLGSYVYGPTVVYGTGFYYNPWYGPYYYPQPWSWGFNIGYNPWYGWSFGFGYSWGWFNIGFGYSWNYWHGGWWGPPIYHPAYCGWGHGYYPHGGYYGNNVVINKNYYINVNNTNNIYRNRGGVTTQNNARFVNNNVHQFNRNQTASSSSSNRPTQMPGSNNGNRQPFSNTTSQGNMNRTQTTQSNPQNRSMNNVFSDRQGNVYQRSNDGWQQRSNRQWAPVNSQQKPEVVQNLNRQQVQRDRGQVNAQNFARARSSFGGGGNSAPHSFGGGSNRSSGGGGHSNRR